MNQVIEMSPWRTLYGTKPTDIYEVYVQELMQPEEEWVSTAGCRQVVIAAEIPELSCSGDTGASASLLLEGSNDVDGAWHTCREWTGPIASCEFISMISNNQSIGYDKLYTYLRWRIAILPEVAEWQMMFRFVATLKH